MGVLRNYQHSRQLEMQPISISPISTFSSSNSILYFYNHLHVGKEQKLQNREFGRNVSLIKRKRRREQVGVVVASSGNVATTFWDSWKPEKGGKAASFSDIVWPSVGAFAAMAVLGKMDQVLASKGLSSITIAPLGAVSAVLFATPSSPGARKYNMFISQIGCAAIGVLAFLLFGPGWLARSTSLAAAIAFMIYTGAMHPPAASLPLLFIDGAKMHQLSYWYAFFPGATGCFVLCLIQEVVMYLKDNFKF